jgi:hypothetical protein
MMHAKVTIGSGTSGVPMREKLARAVFLAVVMTATLFAVVAGMS